ncbi:LppA family lipoprotein, partial [Actinobaculum sp. 352]|uniref:LppA family lipoprotein n=1 Tax=Actinobaculum sp. 352 TaxID=2490946 RepID=UPI0019D14B09
MRRGSVRSGGAAGYWRRGLVVACLMGSVLLVACSDFSERYYGRTDEYLPARSISYVEARREAILLLLELQRTLSDEFEVGEWTPPALGGGSQVDRTTSGCPAGSVIERWKLGTAGPLTGETWPQAVDRFAEILAPLGFSGPVDTTVRAEDHTVVFFNEETGQKVDLGYYKRTLVVVDTGCVPGKWSQDWPQGTEVVPEHLRTTGRAIHSGEPEEWAPYNSPVFGE